MDCYDFYEDDDAFYEDNDDLNDANDDYKNFPGHLVSLVPHTVLRLPRSHTFNFYQIDRIDQILILTTFTSIHPTTSNYSPVTSPIFKLSMLQSDCFDFRPSYYI